MVKEINSDKDVSGENMITHEEALKIIEFGGLGVCKTSQALRVF